MNRKYSISYLILLSAVILAFVFAYSITEPYVESEYNVIEDDDEIYDNEYVDGDVTSEMLPEENDSDDYIDLEAGYIIYSENEYVVVYLYDNTTIFERTEILTTSLPTQLQEELSTGKYIETTEELYGFLENYSS